MSRRSWTQTQLRSAVKSSRSYRQVLIKLKLREAGGNYTQIKKYIQELQLPTSHFSGRGWNLGNGGYYKPRVPLDEILTVDSNFQSHKVKIRLLRANLKPSHCEQCGWNKRTKSGHLPVELHHINGNRRDNRIMNLIVLCPNCHSLTDNHRGRKS